MPASMCCPQRRRLVSPPRPPLLSFTCCASATQSCQTKPEVHKLLLLLLRVSSAMCQACINARRILHRPRLRFVGEKYHAQSVHRIMHKRDTTVTDATAGLISGSSHTASCQLNDMKILLANSRGYSKQASKWAITSVCRPPPKRLWWWLTRPPR